MFQLYKTVLFLFFIRARLKMSLLNKSTDLSENTTGGVVHYGLWID